MQNGIRSTQWLSTATISSAVDLTASLFSCVGMEEDWKIFYSYFKFQILIDLWSYPTKLKGVEEPVEYIIYYVFS